MGSFLGYFRRKNDSRNRVKKTMIFNGDAFDILVVLGSHFWSFLVHMWCPEAIVDEKGEHVFFVDSCMFSKDDGKLPLS